MCHATAIDRRIMLKRSVAAMTLSAPITGCAQARIFAKEDVEQVAFENALGQRLIGYLARRPMIGLAPAVVMLHGRSGLYSSRANGRYDATTLSIRHRTWLEHWRDQGYAALLVDSFGPRGKPTGFGKGTYKQRPKGFDPIIDRPWDAYGALAYLRARGDVRMKRAFLMGWSNGGTAALACMSTEAIQAIGSKDRFLAAASLYPGCETLLSMQNKGRYHAIAPILFGIAGDDDEVDAEAARAFAAKLKNAKMHFYAEANHAFDAGDGKARANPANVAATADIVKRITAFFAAA